MGERLPEVTPVTPGVHTGGDSAPQQSLRDELLAMFPERCRNGGSRLALGQVCEVITLYVDDCIDRGASPDEVSETVAETAQTWEKVCTTGPRNYVTTSLLKCGIAADNFYPYKR